MEVDRKRIGIITTVLNQELYSRTIKFFPKGIKIFAVDGTKGLYGIKSLAFFLKRLKNYELDWLIMADEDVVFTHPERVFNLINYLADNEYTVCGMRDGGVIKWRNKNPYLINTFFAILDLKEIYNIYREKEMLSNQFILKNEFKDHVPEIPHDNYDVNSLYEGYYRFFLWLIRKGKKTKFLHATNPFEEDYVTTLVFDHKGEDILYHTWYARFYGKNKFHTERINRIISKGKVNNEQASPMVLKNRILHFRFFFYKYYRRLIRKFKKN